MRAGRHDKNISIFPEAFLLANAEGTLRILSIAISPGMHEKSWYNVL